LANVLFEKVPSTPLLENCEKDSLKLKKIQETAHGETFSMSFLIQAM
jgi:hypothetical protein